MTNTKIDEIIASELQQLNVTRSTDVGTSLPDPSNSMRAEPRRPCYACGGQHGSVGAGLLCLESEITKLRRVLAPVLKLRAEVAALPPSRVKERGR